VVLGGFAGEAPPGRGVTAQHPRPCLDPHRDVAGGAAHRPDVSPKKFLSNGAAADDNAIEEQIRVVDNVNELLVRRWAWLTRRFLADGDGWRGKQ